MTNQYDSTEQKIRAEFLSVVESYLMLYPTLPPSTLIYFTHAIKSHIHTATILGWPDISDYLIDKLAEHETKKNH